MKYVRVRVTAKEPSGLYRFFLIDYGYYQKEWDESLFTELSEELKNEPTIIKTGSLGLQPSEKVLDRDTDELVTKPVRFWSEKAKSFVQSFNRNMGDAKFFFELYEELPDGTFVGNVIMKNFHGDIDIGQTLIKDGHAMRDKAVKVPSPVVPEDLPNCNFAKIFASLHPEFVPYKMSKPVMKPHRPIAVASGVNFGDYTNRRLTPPKLQVPKPANSPKKPLIKPPTDLMVYGQCLFAPLQSLDAAPFQRHVKEALKEVSTNKVFLHSWAQLLHRRSMLIVGNTQYEAYLYLPAVLEQHELTKKSGNRGIGPVITIIAPTSSSVKTIAATCLRLEKELIVVQAYGMVSSKIDLMNGCDVLVSTPPAFCRLIEGSSIQLINRDRIKTLILDGLDVLIQKFKPEIGKVLKACTTISTLTDANPQIIATSSVWGKEMSSIFKSRVPPESLVVCIENFFEAAIQAGCNISLEINSDIKDKLSKVTGILAKNHYKTVRTVIVVDNDEVFDVVVTALKKTEIKITAAEVNSKRNWLSEKPGSFTVLVTTDAVLSQMKIQNAQELIHFSLPAIWNNFPKRFSCLLDEIYSREEKGSTTQLSSKILLNETHLNEFVRIINFMETRNYLKNSEKYLPLIEVKLRF